MEHQLYNNVSKWQGTRVGGQMKIYITANTTTTIIIIVLVVVQTCYNIIACKK